MMCCDTFPENSGWFLNNSVNIMLGILSNSHSLPCMSCVFVQSGVLLVGVGLKRGCCRLPSADE